MKELSIEEKAKRYDEAIKRAKEINREHSECGFKPSDDVLYIFPELKESEDERIRKELIKFVKVNIPDEERYIAWLEKQGEQKQDVNMQINPSEYINDMGGNGCYLKNITQESTDKVKSKFKVGDWFVSNINKDVFLIKSVNNGYCTLEDIKGRIFSPCLPPTEDNYHLWNIQDAKDGDVLSYRDGQWIFIYKERIGDDSFHYHILYSTIHQNLTINDAGFTLLNNAINPATKEQRKQLKKAMADAGYKWDAEKKELKKIEQKPTDKVEPKFKVGDKVISILTNNSYYITEVYNGHYLTDEGWVIMFNAQDNFELSNQKSAWSEEDEKNINFLCELLTDLQVKSTENEIKYGTNSHSKYYHDTKDWLKSLKDRVQPQPKQEWSEENEEIIEKCIGAIRHSCYSHSTKIKVEKFLKSFKDRVQPYSQWKPSDEQMDALHYVTNFDYGGHKATLVSLYEQLKKLKG